MCIYETDFSPPPSGRPAGFKGLIDIENVFVHLLLSQSVHSGHIFFMHNYYKSLTLIVFRDIMLIIGFYVAFDILERGRPHGLWNDI